MVDGGSYIVALVCLAPRGGDNGDEGKVLDLASVKLRAVQVRHIFGQLYQETANAMQAQHQVEGEEMIHSCASASILHYVHLVRRDPGKK